MKQGKLIIFSGPSGTGKTTIVHHLLAQFPELEFSISATTREKRPKEKEGQDYYFLTPAEFEKKIHNNAFLEYEEVYPNVYYGTLHKELERIWAADRHVIFDVDVKGAINIKNSYPNRSLAVLVRPPSIEVLEQRIIQRYNKAPSNLKERLQRAEKELNQAPHFDKILVNKKLSPTLQEAEQLVKQFLNHHTAVHSD